jgi:hypothetical protein
MISVPEGNRNHRGYETAAGYKSLPTPPDLKSSSVEAAI